jgi:hypothetical protein
MTLFRLERMLRVFGIVPLPVGVAFMVAATLWLRQRGSPIPNLATGEVQPFRFCGQPVGWVERSETHRLAAAITAR